MGYYTDYTMRVYEGIDTRSPELDLGSSYNSTLSQALYKICSKSFVLRTNPIAWKTRNIELKELSKNFPRLLFVLDIKGEDADDWMREYYHNGRMQIEKAVISVGEFDEKKLEE